MPAIWIDDRGLTLYILWHPADTYQVITEDGPAGERHTLPSNTRPMNRAAERSAAPVTG